MDDRSWHIAGDYLEACNCTAVCPCRRRDGVPGGRSTFGVCAGALCWAIREGGAGRVGLAGLAVGLAFHYDDDVEGSPWLFSLYLDEAGDAAQREALEDIFLGRLGGGALEHFPWARKPSVLAGVRAARIEVEHAVERGRFRVHDHVTIAIDAPVADQGTVTCVIPGHDRAGQEVIVEQLDVADDPLAFSFAGRCGYVSTFDYAGA